MNVQVFFMCMISIMSVHEVSGSWSYKDKSSAKLLTRHQQLSEVQYDNTVRERIANDLFDRRNWECIEAIIAQYGEHNIVTYRRSLEYSPTRKLLNIRVRLQFKDIDDAYVLAASYACARLDLLGKEKEKR